MKIYRVIALLFCSLFLAATAQAVVVTSWTFMDGNGVNGINKLSAENASAPQYAISQKKLYATWQESNAAGETQIRVAVYNGMDLAPAWAFVDGNGANGINKDPLRNATIPQLTVYNKKLYAAWREASAAGNQIRVAVYNGLDTAPIWTFVDGNGVNGINKNVNENASQPQFVVLKKKLYLAWREENAGVEQIRVAVYSGNDLLPNWTFVDGNGVNGINKDAARNAFDPQLIVVKNRIYAIWAETSTADQIRVAYYNGDDLLPVWTFVDGNGVNGINKDTSLNAEAPQLTLLRGKLYATWIEENGTRDQVRVAMFNGDVLAPTWTFVDGNGVNGINRDTARDAARPQLTLHGNMLYATWDENNGTATQIRMAVFNGLPLTPMWTLVDGNGVNGINKDAARNARSSQFVSFHKKLFAIWREDNGTANQIRISVGQ
jgi:hypothetical protein